MVRNSSSLNLLLASLAGSPTPGSPEGLPCQEESLEGRLQDGLTPSSLCYGTWHPGGAQGVWEERRDKDELTEVLHVNWLPLCTDKLIPREEAGSGSPLCTHPHVHTHMCQETPSHTGSRKDAPIAPREQCCLCPLEIHTWTPDPQLDIRKATPLEMGL